MDPHKRRVPSSHSRHRCGWGRLILVRLVSGCVPRAMRYALLKVVSAVPVPVGAWLSVEDG